MMFYTMEDRGKEWMLSACLAVYQAINILSIYKRFMDIDNKLEDVNTI